MSDGFQLEPADGGYVELETSPGHVNLIASAVGGDVELRLTRGEKDALGRALLAAEVGE
jgi:hypothetical protein